MSENQVPAAEPVPEQEMTSKPSEWPKTEEEQAQDDSDEVPTP